MSLKSEILLRISVMSMGSKIKEYSYKRNYVNCIILYKLFIETMVNMQKL